MKTLELKKLINERRDIEFDYEDDRYSITYYSDNRKNYISFTKFYETPTDVSTADELLDIKINGKSLRDIIVTLPDYSFLIY